MVEVPQVQIPDFGASIARGQQVQQSRLQGLLAQQALDESQRFNSALPGLAPALATGQGPEYSSALAALLGTGPRGAQIALPLIQQDRQRQELARFDWGGGTPQAAPAATPVSMPGGDPSLPRGIRNNNPLNLTYVAGQPGVQGTDGRFGRYGTPEEGIAAATRQLHLYGQRGLTTPAQIIGRWAPPSENNTGAYVAAVARNAGLDPNQPVDLSNPAVVARLVSAMAQHENGRPIDPAVVQRGVQMGLGGAQPSGDTTAAAGPVTPGQAAPTSASRQAMTPAMAAALERALNSGNPALVAAAQHRMQLFQMQQRDQTDSYQPATENIGGRQIQGQRNARTGQFTPYPGQTTEGGLSPAQANATVARLGPRIARGEIQPDSQEYSDYSAAYAIATRPQSVWMDDPANPGTQRMVQTPGIAFDPTRFPNPVAPSYGASSAPAGPVSTPAAAGATAPAGGVTIGATGMTADPPADAVAVPQGGVTRQAPNSTPSGEENLTAGYARRMVEAEGLLSQAVAGGYVPGNARDAAAGAIAGGRNAGVVRQAAGNYAMSQQGQLYRQAQEDWVRAKLRRESGAVIGDDEMAREIQIYFPQPGDSDAVIAQKAQSRGVALTAMRQGAGRAGSTVPQAASDPAIAQRRRAEDALARARRELPGAGDDAIVERARGYMQ